MLCFVGDGVVVGWFFGVGWLVFWCFGLLVCGFRFCGVWFV